MIIMQKKLVKPTTKTKYIFGNYFANSVLFKSLGLYYINIQMLYFTWLVAVIFLRHSVKVYNIVNGIHNKAINK